jgi:hypothetical protein
VSCKSATYCLVIGGYSDKAGVHPAAWTWNGTTPTLVAPPPLPKADSLDSLSAVSCVAVKSCAVFGSVVDAEGTSVQFIWTWNGSKWALKTAAMPGKSDFVELSAARCFSLTSCVVGGNAVSGNGATAVSLLAAWNGKAFVPQQVAEPAGHGFDFINDVSCTSPGHCAAAGESITSGNALFGFAEVWNGKAWTVTKWTGAKGSSFAVVFGMSCTSAASCVAVGVQGTAKSQVAASLTWNGAHWAAVAVPSAGKGLVSDFEGVSCPKAGACVSIGEYGAPTAPSGKPLAGNWNGKAWTLKAA